MTEITIDNIQKVITAKLGKQKLWFLCFTCCLMKVNISAKFEESISHSFQVTKLI